VLNLNQITTDVPRVIYAQNGYSDLHPITTRWQTSLDRGVFPVAMKTDIDGRVYTFDSKGTLSEYSRAGDLVRNFPVPGTTNVAEDVYDAIDRIVVDEAGYIYVAVSKSTGGVETKLFQIKRVTEENGFFKVHWSITTSAVQAFDFDVRGAVLVICGSFASNDHRLLKYSDIYNKEPNLDWNIQTSNLSNRPRRVKLGHQGASYICQSPDSGTPPFRVGKWFANGSKAWAAEAALGGVGCGLVLNDDNDVITCGPKDGDDIVIRKLLDLGTSYSSTEHSAGTGALTIGVLPTDGSTVTIGYTIYTYRTVITDSVANEVLIGISVTTAALNLSDAINHTTGLNTYSDATPVNLQVTGSPAAGVLTVTGKVKGAAANQIATTTTVAGASWAAANLTGGADVADGGAWSGTDAVDVYRGSPGSRTTTLVLDSNDDVYLAVNTINVGKQVEKRQGNSGHFLYGYSPSDPVTTYSKSITADPIANEPVYRTLSVTGPQQVYVATSSVADLDNIHCMHVVTKDHDRGPNAVTRTQVYTGMCAGNLVTFLSGSSPSSPGGGSGCFEPSTLYPSSTVAFGKLYFSDGIADLVYDPEGFEEIPRRDFVEEWKTEKGGGLMPPNAKLLATCFGRVFRARFSDDGQDWACSERGNPLNYSFFPNNPTDARAIKGNDSRVGVCPDIINALIPYATDLLYFGCDHSIHAMVGDPGARGQFVLVSNTTGVALGMPWCMDPSGVLYFFGSRGGVWALAPGGIPVDITETSIGSALLAVDLTAFKPIMAWNTELQTLHLYFASYRGDASGVQHWRWERHKGWWPDEFSDPSLEPTAIAVFDGDDPNDRKVVIGCADGRVRFIDRTAITDDGFRIESYIELGPFSGDSEVLFRAIYAVLASRQDGCDFEVFVGDEPDNLTSRFHGRFRAGANEWRRFRARGTYVVVRLYNASPGERWAFESMMAETEPIGMRGQRA